MKQLCGIFDLEKGQYCDESVDIHSYVNEECEVYLYGKVRMDRNNIDGQLLWELYKKYGNDLAEHLGGLYIVIIYIKTQKKLQVFQDRTTSPLTLYYTTNNEKVYLSTSLKWALKKSRTARKLNEAVLEDFLVNGFIYGKDTLIENVYKLSAFSSLLIQKGNIEVLPTKYLVNNLSKGKALENWEPALAHAIRRAMVGNEEFNLPLSSGYDSNYIAHIACEHSDKAINAFSIGGKFGKNEVPVVEENVTEYKRMTLTTTLTDDSTLLNLPDIVWRLEGAVYEVGIFLQYELARLVAESGKKSLICGECADQVMNQYYLANDRIFLTKQDNSPIYYEFSEYPYIFGSFLILKKNGILSNSFGIDTEYPYLDNDFVSIAHALRQINAKDKRIHVSICQERLPASVVKNMAKTGGATDFHSLFACQKDTAWFISCIEKSSFFAKYENLIKSRSYLEKEKQTGVQKLKTKIRNIVLDICHINTAERKQTVYYLEEIRLREYMCCAYLMLFEKLFISGDYDDQLDCEGIDVNLYDLI